MKNKLIKAFGNDKLEHKEHITYPQIHVADLTNTTKGREGLKIYDSLPKEIDTLLIENPNLDITATFFMSQCFQNEEGKEPDNCEGVFYLSNSTEKTWVLFLEIKDCKAKKVYANISFPRRNKTDFSNQLIKAGELKSFIDNYNISIRGTNKLRIKDETKIY